MSRFVGITSKNILGSEEVYETNKMIYEVKNEYKDKEILNKNFKKACFSSYLRETADATEIVIDGTKYYVILDGKISNVDEIKKYINFKMKINENTNAPELIAILYHLLGISFLKKINGFYAIVIWCENNSELLLARDRFGIKPLYYTIISETIYFASEIKSILKHKKISAEIDLNGIKQLFGIGPNICPEGTFFNKINILPPASVATFNNYGFNSYKYWSLNAKKHLDSKDETIENVYSITKGIIENQAHSSKNLCCFLSGGLDSSIITSITAQSKTEKINTFSVEYSGNDEYFTPNEFQPDSDIEYINIMSERFNTNHEVITVSPQELIDNLENAVIARDHPGLADVDSSLYCFCKKISYKFDYALSGECADEIFGGYPWFYKPEFLNLNTFPWSRDTQIRENIINKNLILKEELLDFIDAKYKESISETPYLLDEAIEIRKKRELSYLNIKWFMHSLGERSEKIGSNCGLDIIMPFCDYKLIEYVYNIPWDIKNLNNREKGLLRQCFSKDLPKEIFNRKKSPYPKTHNPVYEQKIKEKLVDILNDSDCRIKDFIDTNYLNLLMENESDYGKPWFGQLMAVPQLYAYLVQIDFWLKHYKIKVI